MTDNGTPLRGFLANSPNTPNEESNLPCLKINSCLRTDFWQTVCLATQMSKDYVSPGPWVETVEARVGVDTDKDGELDEWTDWQEVKERYDHTPGFSKQVEKTPAKLDLSQLPEGYGFQFEVRISDSTENDSRPILDRVKLTFD